MAGNKSLHAANRAKQDEFYTQLSDIENELKHYKKHFKGKIVFCNCDDPYESNFFKYFVLNFNVLGLKKLICTCYETSPIANTQLTLFDLLGNPTPSDNLIAHKIEINEVRDENGDGKFDITDVPYLLKSKKNKMKRLSGNGDFRSEECLALLQEADIVVTNPPFSLFKEYMAQLMEYNKSFIIIGNQNAITYKEIFPLIAQNKIWLGSSLSYIAFKVPDYYEERATRFWIDENGQKWRSMGNICWFTNLDIEKRHEELILYCPYSPEKYPKYDNYDAINVDKVKEIPFDYDGVMGVPITFLDKYNPDQFEIVAFRKGNDGKDLVYSLSTPLDKNEQMIHTHTHTHNAPRNSAVLQNTRQEDQVETTYDDVIRPILNGQKLYRRVTIRLRHPLRT